MVIRTRRRNYSSYTSKNDEFVNGNIQETPTRQKSPSLENDYSPVYLPHTQEAFDQLDVVWDWNSPQSKYRQKLPVRKKTNKHESPKPLKRHISNNKIESNDKLKCALEALKNEWQSTGSDKHVSKTLFHNDEVKEEVDNLLFEDDSLEEEMILQSQKIENMLILQNGSVSSDMIYIEENKDSRLNCETTKSEFRKVKSENHIDTSIRREKFIRRTSSNSNIRSPVYDTTNLKCAEQDSTFKITNDSFNGVVESIVGNSTMPHIKTMIVVDSKRTTQAESNMNTLCNSDEIEKKKLFAIARLKSKKEVVSTTNNRCNKSDTITANLHIDKHCKDDISPIKCSPEAIEQKRLQALARLQAKKKQDQIERNRKEALKRLEMYKKKRTMNLSNLYNK